MQARDEKCAVHANSSLKCLIIINGLFQRDNTYDYDPIIVI